MVTEDDIFRLAEASRKSTFRMFVDSAVCKHFKSTHYLSSILISDCICLNILLNNGVTPNSADEIITTIRRRNISFYTTVDSAFFPIEDTFDKYAKTVLGDDEYNQVKSLNMRTTNYIVFVISCDILNGHTTKPTEIYELAYSYNGLRKADYPHF